MKKLMGILVAVLFTAITASAVTVVKSTSKVTGFGVDAQVVSWSGLTSVDDGSSAKVAGYSNKSVQVTGTFTASSMLIQGSNNGVSWTTLKNSQGNALTFSAAGLERIQEPTLYIRPLTSGTASATIKVELFIQK